MFDIDQDILDSIGFWSEIKLEIVRDYASAYSTILAAQKNPSFHHVYIDAFAGAGVHKSKTTDDYIPGSPTNALLVKPRFKEYFFIDIDSRKISALEKIAGKQEDVHVLHGDCNDLLLESVFPLLRYEDHKRGLCLLDPKGLHLDWKVIKTAAELRTIEIFINFPILDMNRNALWRNPDNVPEQGLQRMTRFWGDDSWKEIAYRMEPTLFGEEKVKVENDEIAEAFRLRLIEVAGFASAPKPVLMKNSTRGDLYYLFFASHNMTAHKIIKAIFKKFSFKLH